MFYVINMDILFALTEPEELDTPPVKTAYDPSSLEFLAGFHRDKSDFLKAFVEKHGWPDARRYGEDTEAAAFMIAQHADYDIEFQKHCHQLMLESAKRGATKPGFLAFLTDRILCNQGRHQRFGTQIREVTNGCFVPKPMQDSDHVDELRAQAELGETLSDYYSRVNSGDLLLCRPLLGDLPMELQTATPRECEVIPFPGH